MSQLSTTAFFLWVGGPLPDVARISVLSAAEAGFETVLFTDRPQEIAHPMLRTEDWREIVLPWPPEEVRLCGQSLPYYAGFADLFRYRLLSMNEGWWFDCDTVILKSAVDFARLLPPGVLVLGYEDRRVVNNAVIGARNKDGMQTVYEEALPHYPLFKTRAGTGPRLLTRLSASGKLPAQLQPPSYFYPVHHNDIARIYLPDQREALLAEESGWYCLTLWGEVLSQSGLCHLAPPPGSYLADLLARHPRLGGITGNPAGMAAYLAENLRRLEYLDSGRHALRTLLRKSLARLCLGRG